MAEFRIARLDELPERDLHRFDFFGRPAIAYRRGDRPVAAIDACTHSGGPLALQGETLRCQWHGACFGADDAVATSAPAEPGTRLTLLPLEVRADGSVWYVYAQPNAPGAIAYPIKPLADRANAA